MPQRRITPARRAAIAKWQKAGAQAKKTKQRKRIRSAAELTNINFKSMNDKHLKFVRMNRHSVESKVGGRKNASIGNLSMYQLDRLVAGQKITDKTKKGNRPMQRGLVNRIENKKGHLAALIHGAKYGKVPLKNRRKKRAR